MGVSMQTPRLSGHERFRTILGYCLIGLANTILPSIVFLGAYLIVPFARPIVTLVHILPALAAKLVFPHILPWITSRYPPLVVTLGWVSSTLIIYVSPPNVTPILRILAVAIASVTASASDVLWLGLLKSYGKPGLAGWGLGTGIGGVVCALMPYYLTVHKGQFLRNSLGYAWYLVPMMLVANYLVLPKPPKSSSRDIELTAKDAEVDIENAAPLLHDTATSSRTSSKSAFGRVMANYEISNKLVIPFILPLAALFVGQSLALPGFSRAMAVAAEFSTFTSFAAAYAVAFQLGNMITRSSLLASRLPGPRSSFLAFLLGIGLLFCNALFPVVSGSYFVLAMAFVSGLGAGAVYIGTYASALDDKTFEQGADQRYCLGMIGIGEPVGLVIGGLAAAALEPWLCSMPIGGGGRWCDTTR